MGFMQGMSVDHDHADDRISESRHALARLVPFREKRERRGDPQDDRERMHELPGKRQQQRLAGDFLHLVFAKLREATPSFGIIQPRCRAFQAGKRLGGR